MKTKSKKNKLKCIWCEFFKSILWDIKFWIKFDLKDTLEGLLFLVRIFIFAGILVWLGSWILDNYPIVMNVIAFLIIVFILSIPVILIWGSIKERWQRAKDKCK